MLRAVVVVGETAGKTSCVISIRVGCGKSRIEMAMATVMMIVMKMVLGVDGPVEA